MLLDRTFYQIPDQASTARSGRPLSANDPLDRRVAAITRPGKQTSIRLKDRTPWQLVAGIVRKCRHGCFKDRLELNDFVTVRTYFICCRLSSAWFATVMP